MARRRGPGRFLLAVSGGCDSVFLLEFIRKMKGPVTIAHFNHRTRGRESEKDQAFVEAFASKRGIPVVVGKWNGGKRSMAGFEATARRKRLEFLQRARSAVGAQKILMAHTADDQVETVLMRVFEGAGIAGLKGIPRETPGGIERPILDRWRKDILRHLSENEIPYRVDRSNFDTRFERNWIRHVLIPLLEKRYGESFKKRIFALGERFREIDRYLEGAARRWVARNVRRDGGPASGRGAEGKTTACTFGRKRFGKLPSELRVRILQVLCFEMARIAPNERLLSTMDRLIRAKRSSGGLAVGKGAALSVSYEEARLILPKGMSERKAWMALRFSGAGRHPVSGSSIVWEERAGKPRATVIRKRSIGEGNAFFDAEELHLPLSVRPLRYGDRIRPFGGDGEKKVKEILIDRKIPREERWGRPVVADATGTILWIPGLVRSAHGAVTSKTARTVLLRISDRNA